MRSASLLWQQLPDIPDAEGFSGSYAGVSNGKLLIAGGTNFPDKPLWEGGKKIWTDKVYMLPTHASNWQEIGKLPFPFAYGASVTALGGLICLGGNDQNGHKKDVLLLTYDNDTLVCKALADLPCALANIGAVVLNNKIYVFGGSERPGEQDAVNTLYSLDLEDPYSPWTQEESLPGQGRFLMEVSTDAKSLFVMGGIGLKELPDGSKKVRKLLKEAWSYSPTLGWQRLPDLPRFCAAAPTPAPYVNDRVYLLGGDDASRAGFSPIEEHPGFAPHGLIFDTKNLTWEEINDIVAPRAVLPCCDWFGKFIIVNGELRPGKRSNNVWSVALN